MKTSFSVVVADKLKRGVAITDALLEVIGGIHDGSGPKTSDVMDDLIEMGAWKPSRR